MTTTQTTDTHSDHEVLVISGIVTCMTCDRLVLDASGSRPGLIARNQER